MTKTEVQKILKQSIELLRKIDIPISKNIDNILYFNNKYKRTLATCNKINNTYVIEINSHILNSNKKLLEEIIIHELLHTIKGCYNHSPLFKKYCNKVNKLYDYDIDTLYDSNRIIYDDINIYEIKCSSCNKKYHFYSMSDKVKNTNKYSCSCGGVLIRTK